MSTLATIQRVKIAQYPDAEYIGRPSPLGNPFVIGQHGSRGEVCDAYDEWFRSQVQSGNPVIKDELIRLYRLMQSRSQLYLGCYCGPSQRCHGDTIIQFLNSNSDLLEIWTDETITYGFSTCL